MFPLFLASNLIFLNSSWAVTPSRKEPAAAQAQVRGKPYLGEVGNKVSIVLGKHKCELEAVGIGGAEVPKSFKIEFRCADKKQVLWDIAAPFADDFAFDDPKFELLWAGDKDSDGKIDLEMDMSPKYSCSKKVLYLSSKAKQQDHIVGIYEEPKTICGE